MDTVRQELRAAVTRLLETDLLMGVRSVPLALPKVDRKAQQPPARPATGWRAAATPAGARPAGARPAPAKGVPLGDALALRKLPPEEIEHRRKGLDEIEDQIRKCGLCGLAGTRTKTVFGQGNPAARLVFVGEAPGADEDAQGLAFVGRAGGLLTQMIDAMGLTREQVFICNILKCRPPNNRDPAPNEIAKCWPFLDQQLRIILPEVIVALGRPAAQTLLRTTESIGNLRGRWHDYYISGVPGVGEPTPLMPTYHPAYLLRTPSDKGKTWADLQTVMARLGFPPVKR